jgi:hypothetical protein
MVTRPGTLIDRRNPVSARPGLSHRPGILARQRLEHDDAWRHVEVLVHQPLPADDDFEAGGDGEIGQQQLGAKFARRDLDRQIQKRAGRAAGLRHRSRALNKVRKHTRRRSSIATRPALNKQLLA